MNTTKKGPNPVDVHVGARVRMRRNMIGMSQETLGDALGLTFQQVQKYEKGTNRIGASRLVAIANALQVAPAFFLEGAPGAKHAGGADTNSALIGQFFSLPYTADLARAYVAIAHNVDRRKLVDIAELVSLAPAGALRKAG